MWLDELDVESSLGIASRLMYRCTEPLDYRSDTIKLRAKG